MFSDLERGQGFQDVLNVDRCMMEEGDFGHVSLSSHVVGAHLPAYGGSATHISRFISLRVGRFCEESSGLSIAVLCLN